MADQSDRKVAPDPLVEETAEEQSLREQFALPPAGEVDSEIQIGPVEGLASIESSTEGAPMDTFVDLTQAMKALMQANIDLTQTISQLAAGMTARLDRLEAKALPAPAPAPPAVPVTQVLAVPEEEQPVDGPPHIKQTLYSYKLSKYGGREGSGDISRWVHTALQLVPMMSTRGQNGEPERISMVMQALEGQPRAVAENVFTKASKEGVQVTWRMILDELLICFGDPDAERSARRELNDLKQRPNEDVVAYLTRFDGLSHRIHDLTDADAVSRIESGLREPYKSIVNKVYLQQKVSQPDFEFTPDGLRKLLKRSQRLDAPASGLALNAVNGEPSGSAAQHGRWPERPYLGKNPRSAEEKQRLYREGRCFYCKAERWNKSHKCAKKESLPNEGGVQSSSQGSGEVPPEAEPLTATSASGWKPRNKKDWKKVQASVLDQDQVLKLFVAELMQVEQKKTSSSRMIILHGRIGGREVGLKVLCDSGACGNFISMAVVESLQLPVDQLGSARSVAVADGRQSELKYSVAQNTPLTLSSNSGDWQGDCSGDSTLHVLPHMHVYDIILGTPFFSQWKASLSFKGDYPTMDLLCPRAGGERVTLVANPTRQVEASCISLVTWEELLNSDEAEEFLLCLLTPAEMKELAVASVNTTNAGSTPPPSEGGGLELWDDLHDEIEGVDPTTEPHPPDEFEQLRRELLEKHADVLKDKLPPRGPDNPPPKFTHKIPFTREGEEKPPAAARPRRVNPRDNAEIRRVVSQLLEDGLIRPSSSPMGSAVLFAKKKDGSLRFCIDYRAINAVTKKDAYPLPNIHELLDQLHGAKYFTTIDLVSGYWQIAVEECDIEKTAFTTSMGAFECLFMPFGLQGGPSTFQRAMNTIFGFEMASFLLTYIDDLLVFSKTREEHVGHVTKVLNRLRANGLVANRKKCRFFQLQVEFLGHLLSAEGIRMDPAKVEAIVALAPPSSLSDLRTFLGAAGYYRRFIEKFAFIAAPLTDLTRGGVAFIWSEGAHRAFLKMKRALTTAPVLQPVDMTKPFQVFTDSSNFAVGGALMQRVDEGKNLAPVAYASRVLSQTERNWPTHERELFAIVYVFKKFRAYLLGSEFATTVRTDHKSLTHFPEQKMLSQKQTRWLEFLAEYDSLIKYIEGKYNWVADMLSRLRRQEGPPSPEQEAELEAALLQVCQLLVVSTVSTDAPGLMEVKECLSTDTFAHEMMAKLEKGEVAKHQSCAFVLENEYLYRVNGDRRQLYIPEKAGLMRKNLLEEYHDAPFAGHLGRDKTVAALLEKFWWPSLYNDVEEFVKRCHECQLMKGRHGLVAGKMIPLKTPKHPWEQMTLDLMGPFPTTAEGLDYVVVFVCRFSKMVHIEACRKTDGAKVIAEIFHRHVFKLHGLPSTIISDRDTRWTGRFWQRLFNLLDSRLSMSTAFHPQTDGQTENSNKTIQQVLRILVKERPQDWVSSLTAVEFAINNSKQASTGFSPFEICYGRKLSVPASYLSPLRTVGPVPAVDAWMRQQQEVIKLVSDNLELAQQRQKQYVDRKRSDVEFSAGQMVKLVSSALRKKNQGSETLAKKLSPRFHGPFKIEKMVGTNAAELALSGTVSNRKHRTFNVEKLAPWYESEKFPREISASDVAAATQLGEQIADDTGYVVEAFLDVQKRSSPRGRPRWEIYVKWLDYPDEDNTWEPVSLLKTDLKREFLEFYKIWVQRTGKDPLGMVFGAEEAE